MIRPDYLTGTKNEVFGPGGIQNAVVETLVRTEGPIDAKLIDKNINDNGTYSASAEGADGFKKVVVDVPNTYLLSDEGKVVSGGSLVTQTSSAITENGVVDTTLIDSVTVSVSGSGGNSGSFEVSGSIFGISNITSLYMPSNVTESPQLDGYDVLTYLNTNNISEINQLSDSNLEYLTTVDMPNVISIENRAFFECFSLVSVNMPNVSTIKDEAFYNCSSLTFTNMPNVSRIGDSAFEDCSSLTFANMPNVSTIGIGAFENCSSLTSVNMPNVSTIKDEAFYNCSSLTSINMSNVSRIGQSAFYECSSLTSVNIPNVSTIENQTFENCSSLVSVNMLNVTSIGEGAFSGCISLSSVNIPSSVTTIGASAFYSCPLNPVIIPSGVTEIGVEAFCGCHASEITIPGLVTEADQIFSETGQYASDNEYINNLIFEEGVQTIGYFGGLTNLSTLSIPSTVDTIDEYSFSNCGSNSEQLLITINQNEATSPIAETAPWGASNAQVIWAG